MPRLTTKQYLTAHDHLFGLWSLHKSIFALLTSSEQRVLHNFFCLSDPLPEVELLAHRQAITARHPHLPHQAGKAYRRLLNLEPVYLASYRRAEAEREYRRSHPPNRRTVSKSKHRRVTARGIVRPKPDYHRMSQAIIGLAQEMAKTNAELRR
jgi:hypothetical protein